jgi:hypothetical protein
MAMELDSFSMGNRLMVDYHDMANDRRKAERREYWDVLDEQEKALRP